MASQPEGKANAANRLRERLRQHVHSRAEQLGGIAVELHATAPRGGSYLNRYGQPRSAPGEPPSTEDGTLMSLLEGPPEPINTGAGMSRAGGYAVMTNYLQLEFGTIHIAPRPMGRMAVARLKQEVGSNSG